MGTCESIVDNAHNARYAPRPPNQRCTSGIGENLGGVGRELDATGAATVDQKTADDEIEGIVAGHGERDDICGGRSGGNVDGCQQAGDNAREADGPDGHSSVQIDLASCQLVEPSQDER